jgi:hypothetical protein
MLQTVLLASLRNKLARRKVFRQTRGSGDADANAARKRRSHLNRLAFHLHERIDRHFERPHLAPQAAAGDAEHAGRL